MGALDNMYIHNIKIRHIELLKISYYIYIYIISDSLIINWPVLHCKHLAIAHIGIIRPIINIVRT